MGLFSPTSSLPARSLFRSHANSSSTHGFLLALASLLIALAAGKALQGFGAAGIYFPLVVAAVACAWFGGVGPALICQICGAVVAFSFLIRPAPVSPVTVSQLYGLLGFLVVGKLSLFLTAYMRWTRELQAANGNLKLLASSTNDAVWDWDLASGRVSLTGGLEDLLGYPGPLLETTAQWWRDLAHPEEARSAFDDLQAMLHGAAEEWPREYRLRRSDGVQMLVALRGALQRDRSGKPVRMIGGLSNITALHEMQDRLAFDEVHDRITGLPNRQSFRDALQNAIAGLSGPGSAVAVLFLDLDRFKTVNDSFGHTIGDKLLRAVSKRVELSLVAGETVARFGGDEFTVLVPLVHAPSEAALRAERVQHALATPFELEGHTVVITASIGIALGRPGSYPEDVLRHADVAMYRAKARGRARSEIFESDIDGPRMNLVQLESEIRKGIEEREFALYYQPIVDLGTGTLCGVEALVRWQHPRRGLLLPMDFVPVAEESGLILKLGAWVLRTACADMRSWEIADPSACDFYVDVNVAERQFRESRFSSLVQSCLQESKVKGSRLVLELTENIILGDSADAAKRMDLLRETGVRFALDDFGKGHSSLARLHELPISILKVDCAFIRAIEEGRPILADAIVALGQKLDLEVTAECVETRTAVEHLCRLGCTAAQGNFFASPMTGDALLKLLQSRKNWQLRVSGRSGQ
jgi:diguanylate cyclase (GGDEF)-like protein